MIQLGGLNFLLYPLVRSWHRGTLYRSSLPCTNAHWPSLIMVGKTSLILLQRSLVMVLYMTLQHEMGLKSEAFSGLVVFRIITNLVSP